MLPFSGQAQVSICRYYVFLNVTFFFERYLEFIAIECGPKKVQISFISSHNKNREPIDDMKSDRILFFHLYFSYNFSILIIPQIYTRIVMTTNDYQIMIDANLYTVDFFTIKIIFQFSENAAI